MLRKEEVKDVAYSSYSGLADRMDDMLIQSYFSERELTASELQRHDSRSQQFNSPVFSQASKDQARGSPENRKSPKKQQETEMLLPQRNLKVPSQNGVDLPLMDAFSLKEIEQREKQQQRRTKRASKGQESCYMNFCQTNKYLYKRKFPYLQVGQLHQQMIRDYKKQLKPVRPGQTTKQVYICECGQCIYCPK